MLRAAVIGLGGQSLSDHLPALLAHPDTEVVGAADVEARAIRQFRTEFPQLSAVRTYRSFMRMLDVERPDFVIVAVPHHLYYDIVVELCRRNIPFMKEKPLARTIQEAERLLALPNFGDCGFITAQRHFSGLYSEVWLALGEIGKPYLFSAEYKLSVAEPHVGWRGSRELAGGGCLMDMGYHLVDLFMWWFGMPAKLEANISTMAVPGQNYTAEDSATVAVRYSSGMHGLMLISRSAGEKSEKYQIYGTDGYIIGSKKRATVFAKNSDVIRVIEAGDEDMIEAQLNFFVSRVKGGRHFRDIQQAHLQNMQFIDRCYAAAFATV